MKTIHAGHMNTIYRVVVSRRQDRHATQCIAAMREPALTKPNTTAATCSIRVALLH